MSYNKYGDIMRLRNVKNKEEIMKNSDTLVLTPKDYKGNWNKYFGNDNPIYIEIGMGKGQFIIENANRNPNINYIGIEKYDSVIARALEKVPVKMNNLAMIRMNAMEIDEVFDKEIDIIYLNFSDPWPKKRHHIRRLTSHIFLEKYDRLFKEEKTIIQKTDNRELFEYSVVSLSTYGYKIEEITMDLYNSDIEDNIPTEFEKKFVNNDMKIYRLKAINNKN